MLETERNDLDKGANMKKAIPLLLILAGFITSAGSGTLNAPHGLVLEHNRICSLVKRTYDGEYYLFGELT